MRWIVNHTYDIGTIINTIQINLHEIHWKRYDKIITVCETQGDMMMETQGNHPIVTMEHIGKDVKRYDLHEISIGNDGKSKSNNISARKRRAKYLRRETVLGFEESQKRESSPIQNHACQ